MKTRLLLKHFYYLVYVGRNRVCEQVADSGNESTGVVLKKDKKKTEI